MLWAAFFIACVGTVIINVSLGKLSAMTPDGQWIRIAAEAVLDDNVAAQEHMLDAYPNLKAMYQPGDGNTEVYYLKNAKAQICSFTAPAKEICF